MLISQTSFDAMDSNIATYGYTKSIERLNNLLDITKNAKNAFVLESLKQYALTCYHLEYTNEVFYYG